jgi:hypothetical protein
MTTPGDVRSFAHTGTNSGPSIRGTGSSNPFRSASESLSPGLSAQYAEIAAFGRPLVGITGRATSATLPAILIAKLTVPPTSPLRDVRLQALCPDPQRPGRLLRALCSVAEMRVSNTY